MPTERNRNTGGKKQKTKKQQGPVNRKRKQERGGGGGSASTSKAPSRAGSTKISTTGKAKAKRHQSGGGYLRKK